MLLKILRIRKLNLLPLSTIAAASFFFSLETKNKKLSISQKKRSEKTGNNEEDGNSERFFMA